MPDDAPPIDDWEDEGGALKSGHHANLPDGVTAIAVMHYQVGSYRYTSLADALAQYRRQSG